MIDNLEQKKKAKVRMRQVRGFWDSGPVQVEFDKRPHPSIISAVKKAELKANMEALNKQIL